MKFLREAPPFTQLLFTLIVILVGGIFVTLLGLLGCLLFMGVRPDALIGMMSRLEDPGNISLFKLFQVLQTVGVFILPPLVLAYALDDKPFRFLQLQRKPTGIAAAIVCVVILAGGPLIEWLSAINQHLALPSWLNQVELWMRNSEDQANELTRAFLETKSITGLAGNLFLVAVLPAIGEELLFRGLLQKLIQRMTGNSHWAIWITATLFSALHLQFFGFLPRLLLGALFGYLLEWTGSLWVPVLAHFVNNATGVITFFVTGSGLEPDKPDNPVFGSDLLLPALASGLVLWFLLKFLYARKITEKAMAESADHPLMP